MANPKKRKGDKAERELGHLLTDLLGHAVRRMLGAGRKDDVGDHVGLPDTTIQCAAWGDRDLATAMRVKPQECEAQQARAGTTFGVTALRLHGGQWRFVLTPDQFATLWREAQPL